MNKTEFISAVRNNCSRKLNMGDVKEIVDTAIDTIMNTVASGDKVQFIGFGTFEQTERSERQARNPQTGEEMTVHATKAPKFKAGDVFKDKVKNA